ncbi:MAG: HAD family hydrolase [Acidobacteriota bacterium]
MDHGLNGMGGKLESIVFDFDGTLAELHLDFNDMKRRIGALAREYLRSEPTPSALVPALEWLKSLCASVHELDPTASVEFRTRADGLIVDMELDAARRGCLFPFTRPLLLDLAQRGVKVAIITRNCEEAVRLVFPDLEGYCGCFLARGHVPRVKPDPDHLLQAIGKLSATPGKTLMVGDHPIDIRTGKGAGTLTAGVWSGHATEADLAGSGPDWMARNCEALMTLLRERSIL